MPSVLQDIRQEQGFATCTLRNTVLELSVIPELGARIVSLKNLVTGREWMWHPGAALRLFRNRLGDDFASSPLAGTDECLPTIAACSWEGRKLPDHGEAWTAAWHLDDSAWRSGQMVTRLDLPVSPLSVERTIQLDGSVIVLNYHLTSRSHVEERFLWALHPLLRLRQGDQLQLPERTRALLPNANWVDGIDSAIPPGGCSKLFARPVTEAWASVTNPASGDSLRLEWDAASNNTLGLWLTRGGWHGHDHFAMEPTNGAPDSLAVAAGQGACGVIAPFASRRWAVRIRVGPS